jgi:uncharacterized protein HemX
MIREYTPIEPLPTQPASPPPPAGEKKFGSTGFIAALSVILGIILTSAVLIGGLGKAFFITRDEYTKQETSHSNQNSDLQRSLAKLEGAVSGQSTTLEKQDATLQRLIDKIQTVREDMARRGR